MLILQLYGLYGSRRVLHISPSEFSYQATNDQLQGGLSTSRLSVENDAVTLECELNASADYAWPYCGLSISLGDFAGQGLNLSDYHTIQIDVDFEQLDDDSSPSLRLYLRNFNPMYSVTAEDYTQKYNGLEFTPGKGKGLIDIPINNLQVMTWWLADNQIPIEHSAPEFSNTTMVELATGSGHNSGRYKMTVTRLQFVGNYISAERLMLGLLVFWVSMALAYSGYEIRRSNRVIVKAHSRQLYLSNLNKELREQNSLFAELANCDALTGALNRHSIRTWLNTEYEQHAEERILSSLYLDIDHFKRINDTYGHSMGDDILREFTMVLFGVLSSQHRLVRWGGEEFVIFLPDTELEVAIQLAETIRKTVEAHSWVHGDALTTSIGVATLQAKNTKEMLVRADEALYRAKRAGRNQVVADRLEG